MSKFKKELEKSKSHDRMLPNYYHEKILIKLFKDWQPPKPLIEVPQFVADWFEIGMLGTFSGVIASYSFSSEEAVGWVRDNGGIDLLCKMKLYGYTVKKEQLYILKHIDMSKLSTDDSLYLTHGMYKKLQHVTLSKDVDVHNIDQLHFTKSEVDELNVGSYEQIEVDK